MDIQQLITAQKHILDRVKAQEQTFKALRIEHISLIEKWQKFLGIILPIQLDTLRTLGFGTEQADLSIYNFR